MSTPMFPSPEAALRATLRFADGVPTTHLDNGERSTALRVRVGKLTDDKLVRYRSVIRLLCEDYRYLMDRAQYTTLTDIQSAILAEESSRGRLHP